MQNDGMSVSGKMRKDFAERVKRLSPRNEAGKRQLRSRKMSKVLLDIKGLDLSFQTRAGYVHTLRGVDLRLHEGECVAIVGESGSGKSTAVKTVVGLMDANARINGGSVRLLLDKDGREEMTELLGKSEKFIRREVNGRKVAMVFQDPMTSLDPLMKIGKQIIEAICQNTDLNKKEARKRAQDLLEEVGIPNAGQVMENYPHQLSGGMRQRVVIAIAISCDPQILICDEPTTALDVTTQEKILTLITQLQVKRHLAVLFITHNLGVVARVADYIYVMYAGKIVEKGTDVDLFYDPRHPYTWCLLSAVPSLDMEGGQLYSLPGTPPNLLYEVKGDAFAPRNPYALNIDFRKEPPMFQLSETHYAATWLLSDQAPPVKLPQAVQEKIAAMKAQNKEEAGNA